MIKGNFDDIVVMFIFLGLGRILFQDLRAQCDASLTKGLIFLLSSTTFTASYEDSSRHAMN